MAHQVNLGWDRCSETPLFDQGYKLGGRPIGPPPPSGTALFTDNFETGTIGNQPSASNAVWTWDGGAFNTVSDEQAYSGTKSLKFLFLGSANVEGAGGDSWAEQRFLLDKKYTDLWIRYKLYVPSNYAHRLPVDSVSNNKGLINLWSEVYTGYAPAMSLHFGRAPQERNADGSSIYPAWRPNADTVWNITNVNNFDANVAPSTSDIIDGLSIADRGTWVDWVIHVKCSTIPIPEGSVPWEDPLGNPITGDGCCEVWKNGTKIMDVQNATNYYDGPGGDGWNEGYLLGAANSGFDADTLMYIDEFVVAESAAGVEFTP